MRAILWTALLVATVLAGCSEGPAPATDDGDAFDDLGLHASETTGVIRGIVVDEAIVPVQGVQVRIVDVQGFAAETDAEGRFGFSEVPAGPHLLNISSPLHRPVQAAVTVQAGDDRPALVKVQVQRLFDKDPYIEQQHIQGYMNCGYSAGLSSPCILDYTQLLPVCPGGCLPQLYGISGDIRRFVVAINEGWQSRINEIVWEPSTGTSESLGMTISFYNRTSSHSYTGASGPSPLRHKMDMDPERTHPDWVPPEGKDDYLVFVNPSTRGSELPVVGGEWPVAVMLEQRFELFVNTFYYGMPPEDWSFVRGDPSPW